MRRNGKHCERSNRNEGWNEGETVGKERGGANETEEGGRKDRHKLTIDLASITHLATVAQLLHKTDGGVCSQSLCICRT